MYVNVNIRIGVQWWEDLQREGCLPSSHHLPKSWFIGTSGSHLLAQESWALWEVTEQVPASNITQALHSFTLNGGIPFPSLVGFENIHGPQSSHTKVLSSYCIWVYLPGHLIKTTLCEVWQLWFPWLFSDFVSKSRGSSAKFFPEPSRGEKRVQKAKQTSCN